MSIPQRYTVNFELYFLRHGFVKYANTVCKCVNLAVRAKFQWHDEDGANTMAYAIPKNPITHANLTVLSVIGAQPRLHVMDVKIARIDISTFFVLVPSVVDLDTMTYH